MKNDVSKISVSVIVNHTNRTTTVKMFEEHRGFNEKELV